MTDKCSKHSSGDGRKTGPVDAAPFHYLEVKDSHEAKDANGKGVFKSTLNWGAGVFCKFASLNSL